MNNDLGLIKNLIEQLNSGNFQINYELSDSGEQLNAILTGINVLSLELKKSKSAEELLNRLFQEVPDLLAFTDIEFNITRANKLFALHTQIDEKDLKSLNIFDFLSEGPHIINKLQNNIPVQNMEVELKQTQHITNTMALTVLKIDMDNPLGGYLFIMKDLSRLRKVENELQIKNKELESFLYSTSHHLKGPLATILGLTNIVNDKTSIDEFREYFAHINTMSTKLNETLVDLAEFPKLGSYQFVLEEVDLQKITKDTINKVRVDQGFGTVPIDINIDFSGETKVLSVKKSIYSILHGLLENAFKFQKQLRDNLASVTINIVNGDSGTLIEIIDNGYGIRKEIQPKLFELFKTGSHVYNGTGLGLYIVKTQVQRLNGTIEVGNNGKRGTKATVWLPKNSLT